MTQPAAPPGGPGGPGGKKKPGGLDKNKKLAVGVAAVGGVAALALYMRAKNGSSSAGSPATGTTTTAGGVQGTYDSTGQDLYDSVESQIQALQNMIGQSTTGTAPTTPKPPPVPPRKPGPKPKPRPKPKPKPKLPRKRKGGTVPRSRIPAPHVGHTGSGPPAPRRKK